MALIERIADQGREQDQSRIAENGQIEYDIPRDQLARVLSEKFEVSLVPVPGSGIPGAGIPGAGVSGSRSELQMSSSRSAPGGSTEHQDAA